LKQNSLRQSRLRQGKTYRNRDWGFLIPALLCLGVFYYYPFIQSALYSFFRLEYTTDWLHAPFVGVQNYVAVLGSYEFWHSLRFTALFTLGAVALDLSLGMLLALSAYWIHPFFKTLLRIIIIIPWAIPRVIQASIWRWMFNSDVGIVGTLLVRLGLAESPPLFLGEPALALMSVVMAYVWKGASISAVFLMAGLASVPRELQEASRIDGAGGMRRFFSVTVPVMAPTIVIAGLFRTRDALRVFDVIIGLTGGGPGMATESLSTYAYRIYFDFNNYGIGSAYAVIIFIGVAVLSGLYIKRFLERFEFVK